MISEIVSVCRVCVCDSCGMGDMERCIVLVCGHPLIADDALCAGTREAGHSTTSSLTMTRGEDSRSDAPCASDVSC